MYLLIAIKLNYLLLLFFKFSYIDAVSVKNIHQVLYQTCLLNQQTLLILNWLLQLYNYRVLVYCV